MKHLNEIKATFAKNDTVEYGWDGVRGRFPYKGEVFTFIFSWDGGWEHLSVSTPKRCPTWGEMSMFKSFFWRDDEAAMQLHPPTRTHINLHENCLHIWKPTDVDIPLPPLWMV